MNSKLYVFLFLLFSVSFSFAQDIKEVEVKGQGLKREDALQDALRNAVSEAIGVSLVSETKVENFMVIQDAIQTRIQGYISSYDIVKEIPFPDRFEITLKARVSLNPIKADIHFLAQSIGGIRFLVMYDENTIPKEELASYESAIERINGFLSERKYRYIEANRFKALQKESVYIMKEQGGYSEDSYVQKLGMLAEAQFIIFIKKISVVSRSEAFDTRTSSKVSIEVKTYDNCTAEGLGTVLLESDWKNGREAASTISNGLNEAIKNGLEKLLVVFNTYIGEWVNNGTPFELRFYSSGTYRDLRDLRMKLKEDKNFGGQLEMIGLNNFTKLNCTFRKKPDELADKILDYADEIPFLKEKRMDVKLIYGRQISFAPHVVKLPDMPISNKSDSTVKPLPVTVNATENREAATAQKDNKFSEKSMSTEEQKPVVSNKVSPKRTSSSKKTTLKTTKSNSQIKK